MVKGRIRYSKDYWGFGFKSFFLGFLRYVCRLLLGLEVRVILRMSDSMNNEGYIRSSFEFIIESVLF